MQCFMKSRARGFTLIEVMVVVVILGILATLIVPKLMNRPDDAKRVKVMADIRTLEEALELYRLDNGIYPTEGQGLDALVKQPSQPPQPDNWQAYLKRIPKDPWGQAYRYRHPGRYGDFDVYTLDRNQQEVGNWDLD